MVKCWVSVRFLTPPTPNINRKFYRHETSSKLEAFPLWFTTVHIAKYLVYYSVNRILPLDLPHQCLRALSSSRLSKICARIYCPDLSSCRNRFRLHGASKIEAGFFLTIWNRVWADCGRRLNARFCNVCWFHLSNGAMECGAVWEASDSVISDTVFYINPANDS